MRVSSSPHRDDFHVNFNFAGRSSNRNSPASTNARHPVVRRLPRAEGEITKKGSVPGAPTKSKKGLVSEALRCVDRLLRPQGRRSYFFFFAAAFFFGAAFFLVAIVYSPNRNSRLRKIACVIHI